MIEKEDYIESECLLCKKADSTEPIEHIPVSRILEKVDNAYNKEDYVEANRILEYWENESEQARDISGQISVLSEMMGLYRKTNEKDKAIIAIEKGFKLLEDNEIQDQVSAGTIYLNGATTLKAFNMTEKAMPYYEKAEKIYNKLLNKDDQKFGGLYNNMALAFVDLKKYDKAEELYNKAIQVMIKFENGKLEAAITLVNMAHMYFDSLDMDSCIPKIFECMEKAYQYLNDETLPQNGYYAFVCSKCIPSFEFFGYTTQKEVIEKRVKEIYERIRNS